MGLSKESTGAGAAGEQLVIRKQAETDKVVALAGNPNVGKSTVFNELTGMHQHTGNWPGKTVTNAQGTCTVHGQGYVLVDFYGDGCVPCAALMPHIHKFEEVYGTTVKFCSLNTTKARRLAIAQKVLGLPVIAIYKDGEMIDSRVKDDATPEGCEEMIRKYA